MSTQAGVDQHWQILVGRRKRRATINDEPRAAGGFVRKNETEEGGRLADVTGGSRTVLAVPTSHLTLTSAAGVSNTNTAITATAVAVPLVPPPVKTAPSPPHAVTPP